MADNELFSVDDKLDLLPLISKERTQRFELLLHLIPNLKQHLILCGQSGIGKTLLLDMLYDIDSDVWQCCFIQGSADLSFETIEAQLTKTMLRNKHVSLDSALQNFKEQHKKIVLIIDDAGLLVSGLMTTLIEYAAAQPAIKLIFSLTPETKQAHRNTDKALNDCYILELPPLSKSQCAYFLRHLAAKPRTYGAIPIDEKLVEKIYADTNGIPAKIIHDFNKLSRKNENDYSKWIAGFIGVTVLAIGINQSVRYFKKDEPIDPPPVISTPEIQVEKKVEPITKTPVLEPTEKTDKPELDIVIPEFKLDIEKGVIPAQTTSTETQPAEKSTQTTENVETPPAVEPEVKKEEKPQAESKVETEKVTETAPEKLPEAEKNVAPVEATKPEPLVEKIPQPVKPQIEQPKIVAPQIAEPVKPKTPEIAFPKIQPAKGVKIQALPEKNEIHDEPIPAPVIKEVKPQAAKVTETKVEEKPVVEIQNVEDVKKEALKNELAEKKAAAKLAKEKAAEAEKEKQILKEKKAEEEKKKAEEKKIEKEKIAGKQAVSTPNAAGRYSLQLITLSSEAAVENFKKKHAALGDNIRVIKSGTQENPRFGLMYGGFSNTEEATKAKQKLPAEFADALPRKSN